ncbi:flavin-containing monooxygenase [Nocardioides jishulii]|uniref:NAD(P)/FAD-dependent oxidoreductase n=1 Tax=Nocardioides jishulii TaxID=2575440 RepID=A0A4U2YUX4_9ACTN|nr:NAD(P)/FAD-dependent oxidoreductase [Nocardioides jishulii]QCX28342.1 NAD(P)/FAD-dependent oxidoreductase [Nocardioides jishulii]TKI64765.1 NAD(P)/FAD-dependent oxidoreductase [Nocardioides jishulii]
MSPTDQLTWAVIGAGPTGLAAARALQRHELPWAGYEAASGVGGLWDISSPRSTVYESAHLISSRTTTEFAEFPMETSVADYPDHRALKRYFDAYADHFGLRTGFAFDTEVTRVEPSGTEWLVTSTGPEGTTTRRHAGVLIANGTLAEPAVPTFEGSFDGEVLHTSRYKSARTFADQRVLIIGAGNSGCDIAVDAVHHAASVDLSVRRGYYFVPKYMLGKPSDTLNQGKPMPRRIKQALDSRLLRLFTGDPVKFGFPKPDYKIYESHPVVNSLVLHHVGHGDIDVRGDVARFEGHDVLFKDGTRGTYDTVVLATGYHLHYPFVDPAHLNWTGPGSGTSPDLHLNIFPGVRGHEATRNLFVLGMVEASGLGWQGRYEQAELVAGYLAARGEAPERAEALDAAIAGPRPDLTAGYRYLGLERMSYYVNKDAYRTAVREASAALRTEVTA